MSERGAAVRAVLTAAGFKVDAPTALRVLEALEELGWARPELVRIIVASAGGRVIIPDAMMVSPPRELRTWVDPATDNRVIVAS